MKVELVKRQDRWDLYGEDGSKIASSAPNPMGKLSIKNCEAIENGYDLDELSKSYAIRDDISDEFDYVDSIMKHFKAGFQKALSILVDKKFSEDDMLSFESFVSKWYDKAKDIEEFTALPSELLVKWKSLQQTEFDVEIVTKPYTEVGEGFELESKREPKLDKDGCLILKRL